MSPTCGQHGEYDSVILGTFIAAKEQPGTPPHGDVLHFPFGVIIVNFQIAVFQILCEKSPVVQTVEKRLAVGTLGWSTSVLIPKPFMKGTEQSAPSCGRTFLQVGRARNLRAVGAYLQPKEEEQRPHLDRDDEYFLLKVDTD